MHNLGGGEATWSKDSDTKKENSFLLAFFFSLFHESYLWDFLLGFSQDKGKRRKGREILPHVQTEFAFYCIKIFLKLQLSNKSSPVAKIKRVGRGKFIR